MISTKLSLQNLALVLVVFTVFTVSLTETIQISDGFSSEAKKIVFKMQVGETQSITWGLVNEKLIPIDVEMYAEGAGSELIVMERYVTIPPQTRIEYEIFVIVPPDHEDNVEFHPSLFALKRGFLEEGQTGAVVNMRMKNLPVIEIGDNPIYTPTEAELNANSPKPKVILPDKKTVDEKSQAETLEEKLARINAANTAVMGETPAQATGQFEVEDPVLDFEPGPQADPEAMFEINPVGTFIEEPMAECDFIAWFLSLFGMGKC